ncbi:MAG: hypothetical protein HY898_33585 [Deltaproteobacteria bacterium]|nr:hypothetical protein [Deltaproteobacteria bacterium]
MSPAKSTKSLTTPETVSRLLSGLLMRPITVKRSTVALNLAAPTPAVVAHFQTNEGEVSGVCVFDLPLAAHLAACLSLVPAGVAQEAIRARSLSPGLMENFKEILNVCSQLFLADNGPRISFRGTLAFPGTIPDPVREVMFHPVTRLDVEVMIPAYGNGKMTLRAA